MTMNRPLLVCLVLVVGCDDLGLTGGQIEQVSDRPIPGLSCAGVSRVARVIPNSGWLNQVAIEAYAPDDDAGPELAVLVSKFGLVAYTADPRVDAREGVFYSWNGDKPNKVCYD